MNEKERETGNEKPQSYSGSVAVMVFIGFVESWLWFPDRESNFQFSEAFQD